MLELAARLALSGELRVLDGGNRFNVYPVARTIRRYSPELTAALARIRLARAFTCYQAAAMLAEMPAEPRPLLVIDLLATFYDESVNLNESRRLLAGCIPHLQRLSRCAPVVVSAKPPAPRQPERARAGGSPADMPLRVPGSLKPLPAPRRRHAVGPGSLSMGRTLPSITQEFMQEQEAFARFRRALRRADQLALDDLFASARQHLSAAAYAAHALPMETFLLSMLLEQHKEVLRLRRELDELRGALHG